MPRERKESSWKEWRRKIQGEISYAEIIFLFCSRIHLSFREKKKNLKLKSSLSSTLVFISLSEREKKIKLESSFSPITLVFIISLSFSLSLSLSLADLTGNNFSLHRNARTRTHKHTYTHTQTQAYAQTLFAEYLHLEVSRQTVILIKSTENTQRCQVHLEFQKQDVLYRKRCSCGCSLSPPKNTQSLTAKYKKYKNTNFHKCEITCYMQPYISVGESRGGRRGFTTMTLTVAKWKDTLKRTQQCRVHSYKMVWNGQHFHIDFLLWHKYRLRLERRFTPSGNWLRLKGIVSLWRFWRTQPTSKAVVSKKTTNILCAVHFVGKE